MLGRMGPPLLTFARRCAASGVGAYLLAIGDSDNRWNRYSAHLAGGAVIVREQVGTPQGVEIARSFVEAVGADGVIAVSDTHLEWLASNQAAFGPRCKVLAPPIETLRRLESKRAQVELAHRAGFDLLPTWYVSNLPDCRLVPEHAFPVAVRPTVPKAVEPTFKVRLAQSVAELESLVGGLRAVRDPLIVQPFRDLPNLVVHGVRSEGGHIIALRPFLVYRKFEGVTLSIKRTQFPPGVEEACRRFADAAGIIGCFHYELLLSASENRAYFLEINTRLGGTTDKVARLGYDEPLLSLQAFGLVGATRAEPEAWTGPVVNKRALIKHMCYALRGRLSDLDHPPVGRFGHLWRSSLELLLARDSVLDWRDIRGSLWFYLQRPQGQ
jgi:biotin carboxylase